MPVLDEQRAWPAAARRGVAAARVLPSAGQVLINPFGLKTYFLAAPWSKSL
jgi:hypothetical protein